MAELYQRRAVDANSGRAGIPGEKARIIAKLKAEGRASEIQPALEALSSREYVNTIEPELCHVSGRDFDDYLHDIEICQEFARLNRETMAAKLLELAGLSGGEAYHTVHNYIDTDEMVLRKGAIRANAGEKVLIPLNMRDGSIIAKGRGNEAWNNSAPHGAGRVMSRGDARRTIGLKEYRESMEGIYSTSVCESTIDEAPAAYKPIEDIIGPIAESVDIVDAMYVRETICLLSQYLISSL